MAFHLFLFLVAGRGEAEEDEGVIGALLRAEVEEKTGVGEELVEG